MRSSHIGRGSAAFVAAVALFLLLPVVDGLDVTRFLSPLQWAQVCTAVGFLPAICSAWRRDFDLFAPIWLMMAYLGFLFGLRGVYLLESGAYRTILPFASEQLIARALALATLGMLGLSVGYFSRFGERLGHALPRLKLLTAEQTKYPNAVIAVAACLGVCAYGVLSLSASQVTLSDVASEAGSFWLSPFEYLLPLAMCLLFLNSERLRVTRLASMMILYGLIWASWLFWFPSKAMVLRPLFYILVIIHYRRRRLSVGTIGLLLCAFVVVRLAAFAENVLDWNLSALGAFLLAKSTSWADLWELLFSRFYDLDALVVALKHIEHTGQFLLGASYKELLYWYVPRWFWPGKPFTWSYRWGEIYDQYTNYSGHSFTATTLFGDFYMNFGVAGVLVGAPLIGVIARSAYVYLVERTESKSAVLLYAVVLMHLLMRLSGAVPEAVAMAVTEVVPLLLVLAVSRLVWLERRREEFAWLASAFPEMVYRQRL